MVHRVNPIIADQRGTCTAVVCPVCTRAFIVSATLDQHTGRDCPHCEMYHARLTDDTPRFTVV